MNRRNPNFKSDEFEFEISLSELLRQEEKFANEYNDSLRAYILTKKNSLSTQEVKRDILEAKDKLEKARARIKEYCSNNLGLKTNLSTLLYECND